MKEEIPKIIKISEKEIFCEKHGKQEDLGNDFGCPECFNNYWKKRYFL